MSDEILLGNLPTVTSAAGSDLVTIWRASNLDTRIITKANFIGAVLTGGGTIATGGFAGTLPATGTLALRSGTPTTGRVASWASENAVQDGGFAVSDIARLSQVQTFAANQQIDALLGVNMAPTTDAQVAVTSGAATRNALELTPAASPTAPVLRVNNAAGGQRFAVFTNAGSPEHTVVAITDRYVVHTFEDFGVSGSGGTLTIDVTSTSANRRPFTAQFVHSSAVGGGSDNRANLHSIVSWATPQTAGSNGLIRQTSEAINNTTNATITGPTAITNGIRYVITNSGASGHQSTLNSLTVSVWGRGATAVSVTIA